MTQPYTIQEFKAYRLEYIGTGQSIGPIFPSLSVLRKYLYNNYYKKATSRVMTPTKRREAMENMRRMQVRKYLFRQAPVAPPMNIRKVLNDGDKIDEV